MILIGRFLSPFVRRTAIVLNELGIDYEQRSLNTADDAAEIRSFNPLGRVPSLVLDDGEVIFDSNAIIDHVLEVADTGNRLLAEQGAERRHALRLSVLATGAMEKGVASAYEASQRPAEFFYEPYRDRLRGQALAGLENLEDALGDAVWFGGEAPNLADINAVVAYDFVGIVAPKQLSATPLARLAGLSERANARAAFGSTRWTGGVPQPAK